MYFGRIFGFKAIFISGMLDRPTSSTQDLQRIIKSLLEFASSKAYLREASFDLIISIVKLISSSKSSPHHLSECLPDIIESIVKSDSSNLNPETLWFVIVLQYQTNLKVCIVYLFGTFSSTNFYLNQVY